MADDVSRVREEMEEQGFPSSVRDSEQGTVVEFDYLVDVGPRKGERFKMGISFQEGGYPEYPPHWIHVSPRVEDGIGGVVKQYTTDDGRVWVAMSRPPKEYWDRLSEKNMKNYVNEHLRRFWNCVSASKSP